MCNYSYNSHLDKQPLRVMGEVTRHLCWWSNVFKSNTLFTYAKPVTMHWHFTLLSYSPRLYYLITLCILYYTSIWIFSLLQKISLSVSTQSSVSTCFTTSTNSVNTPRSVARRIQTAANKMTRIFLYRNLMRQDGGIYTKPPVWAWIHSQASCLDPTQATTHKHNTPRHLHVHVWDLELTRFLFYGIIRDLVVG